MSNRRQHPITIITSLVQQLKLSIFPFLSLFLLIRNNIEEWKFSYTVLFIVISLLLLVISSFMSWLFTVYRLEGEELYFRQGVLVKKELYIKRERVQTISTRAGLLHQILSLQGLAIETAGGGKSPDIYLHAISALEAEKILAALKKQDDLITSDQEVKTDQAGVPIENLPAHNGATTYFLSGKDLFLAGLTSGEVGLLFAGLALLYSQIQEYIPETWYMLFLESIQNTSVLFWLWIAISALVISWLLSTLRFALKYANFRVYRSQKEIKITRGLLERRQIVIKLHRIQGLTIVEGLLREPFGFASIEIEAIGGTGGERVERIILHPFIRKAEIEHFLASILPEYTYTEKLRSLPKRAARRFMFRYALIPLLASVVLIYVQPIALFTIIFPILAACLGYAAYTASGYQLLDDQIIVSTRKLAKVTGLVRRKHIQEIGCRETIFQKKANLQTSFLSIISSPTYRNYAVRDLDKEDVQHILKWFGE